MSDRVARFAVDEEPAPGGAGRGRTQRRLPGIALGVALLSLLVAVWAVIGGPSFLNARAEGGDADSAKLRACAAFDLVSTAVPLRTNDNLGPGEVAGAAVAANARLALLGGGIYLLNMLDPGTPRELAEYVRSMAHDLQDVGLNALAGVDNGAGSQATLMANIEQTRKQIANLCE